MNVATEACPATGLLRQEGEGTLARLRQLRFADLAHSLLGDDAYEEMKRSLARGGASLEDRTNGRIPAASVVAVMEKLGNETPYEFVVDGVALNVASLPFVLTDRIGTGSWLGAAYTRTVAFLPNFFTGRMFGSYQDAIVTRLDTLCGVREESRPHIRLLRQWPGRFTAFLTGQTWLYGAYLAGSATLAGEQPDTQRIVAGMFTLSIAAPLVGPLSDFVYRKTRIFFGLPERPGYMQRIEHSSPPRVSDGNT